MPNNNYSTAIIIKINTWWYRYKNNNYENIINLNKS